MSTINPPPHPPTLIFGNERPELRFRSKGRSQQVFCINNENLHLGPGSFTEGTFEMGSLLGAYCLKYCAPHRGGLAAPCPALVESHMVETNDPKQLATAKLRPIPHWTECRGVERIAKLAQTPEERFFLLAYLEDKYADESTWRDSLVEQWNSCWSAVPLYPRRSMKFDHMLWRTIRFPALIPQVWLNWLHATEENVIKELDEKPSRVDFVAFWRGHRYVVEIDGPSHYANWDGQTLLVDERSYARNLKIERSLRRDGWHVIRVGRIEVREVMEDEVERFFGSMALLGVLPFRRNAYPEPLATEELGVPELWEPSFDDIPF